MATLVFQQILCVKAKLIIWDACGKQWSNFQLTVALYFVILKGKSIF